MIPGIPFYALGLTFFFSLVLAQTPSIFGLVPFIPFLAFWVIGAVYDRVAVIRFRREVEHL